VYKVFDQIVSNYNGSWVYYAPINQPIEPNVLHILSVYASHSCIKPKVCCDVLSCSHCVVTLNGSRHVQEMYRNVKSLSHLLLVIWQRSTHPRPPLDFLPHSFPVNGNKCRSHSRDFIAVTFPRESHIQYLSPFALNCDYWNSSKQFFLYEQN
jgi:hypothetical protein